MKGSVAARRPWIPDRLEPVPKPLRVWDEVVTYMSQKGGQSEDRPHCRGSMRFLLLPSPLCPLSLEQHPPHPVSHPRHLEEDY